MSSLDETSGTISVQQHDTGAVSPRLSYTASAAHNDGSSAALSLSSSVPSSLSKVTNNRSRNRPRANALGFSPIRHITTTYRIRSSRPKPKLRLNRHQYDPLPADEELGAGRQKNGHDNDTDIDTDDDDDDDDDYSDICFVDEDTLMSQDARGRTRRRCWLVCGMVCGLVTLITLLILTVLLFAARSVYDGGDSASSSSDPDAIFTEAMSWYPTDFLRDVVPIPCHSHNDYWRTVPLFSALHAGCIGTEADVWLVGDDLYVGHERSALTPNRTFQSLYVDPLIKILERANPNTTLTNSSTCPPSAARGVFDRNPNQTLALLVDVKTDGAATFRKVLQQVEPLRQRGWLSTFADGKVTYGPVTLVGSGNTPFDSLVENGTYRYAFFDAPLESLENTMYDTTNSYYASVALSRGIGRVWFGIFRRGQLRTLRYQLQQAHARGLQARYWGLPTWPISVRNAVWSTLVAEGVDLLNVDDIWAAARTDWSKTKWV